MGRVVKRFGRVVPAVVLDARAEAEAMLASARREAEQLVASARAQAAAVLAEARRHGEESGRAEAERAFTTMLLAARADAARVRAAAIPAARVLAVRMAEKIVARTVDLDPHVLTELAARALATARARAGVVTLRVHPDDRAAFERSRPELAGKIAADVELRLIGDPAVGRHGCVVETPAGRLDARLDTQLEALAAAAFAEPAAGAGDARREV